MIPSSSIYLLIKLHENGSLRSIHTHSTFRKVNLSHSGIIHSVKTLKNLNLLTAELAENSKVAKIYSLTDKGKRVAKLYKQIEIELKGEDIWRTLGIK